MNRVLDMKMASWANSKQVLAEIYVGRQVIEALKACFIDMLEQMIEDHEDNNDIISFIQAAMSDISKG